MGKRNRLRRKHGVIEDILEKYIRAEDRGLTPFLPVKHNGGSVGRRLTPVRLAEIRKCPECKFNPVAYLTAKKIPVCAVCWGKLADAQIGWDETSYSQSSIRAVEVS